MKGSLGAMAEYGQQIHRVIRTKGIMRLLDREIDQRAAPVAIQDVDPVVVIGRRAANGTITSVNTAGTR